MHTKSFLITGAGSFLGRAIVACLEKDPETKVFLTSRKTYEFEILEKRKDWRYMPGIDLLVDGDIQQLSLEVDKYFLSSDSGKLVPEKFHVINCVGGYWDHFAFTRLSLAESRKTIEDNLTTVLNSAYFFMPILAERNGGHFITFGCNSTRHHYPYMTPFTVAKAGLATMMKCLASEYAKFNVQCNCYLLATIKNKREHNTKPFGDYENWLDPKDIAEIVINATQVESTLMNGSEIELWKYSERYNWDGYFQRIKKA